MTNADLKSFVTRIENLLEEKKALTTDIAEVFKSAKSAGFDPRVMRALIKKRAQDAADLAEFQALLETYENAVG